jgi:hypothetical protein
VRNEEVLQIVKEERNILHTANRWKANCLLKHVVEEKTEGRIEVTGKRRRRRRRKQLLDDLKVTANGTRKHKNRALWRTGFG